MENLQPPKTIEEVGIHLVYMAETIKALGKKFDAFQDNHLLVTTFLEYQDNTNVRIKALEERSEKSKDFEAKWAGRVWGINSTIAIIAGIVVFIINIFVQKYYH